MKKRRNFSKKQANRLLYRLYRNIKDKTARVTLDNKIPVQAYCYYDKPNRIILNPDHQIISCFVHEYLHIFYDNEDYNLSDDDYENWILEMEDELVNHHWSMRQLENILKRIGSLVRFKK